jgi:hypothetical protein
MRHQHRRTSSAAQLFAGRADQKNPNGLKNPNEEHPDETSIEDSEGRTPGYAENVEELSRCVEHAATPTVVR